jgi:hypothetical protein
MSYLVQDIENLFIKTKILGEWYYSYVWIQREILAFFLSLRDTAKNIRIVWIYKCKGRVRKEKLKLKFIQGLFKMRSQPCKTRSIFITKPSG